MNGKHRILAILITATGVLAFSGATLAAKPDAKASHQAKGDHQNAKQKKAHHQNGKQLLGDKIKSNGHHVLEQKGDVTASVDVKDGKIIGLHAKHAKKGDLQIKKYKTTQKMVKSDGLQGVAHLMPAQYEYVGSTYIGYSYYDDYGYEQIYWFPVDMIYDGDTGAIEYVPTTY